MTEFSKLHLFWGVSSLKWIVIDNNDPGPENSAFYFNTFEEAYAELLRRVALYKDPEAVRQSARSALVNLLDEHFPSRIWDEWNHVWRVVCITCTEQNFPCQVSQVLLRDVLPALPNPTRILPPSPF